ncbi:MAG: DUF3891 family protein [Alphaproteobacteria bacterium]|nr:DUF3891 family protein [Alphaproteobacteria bacterium]
MIVQTAPEGEQHFVIKMTEHTEFAGLLARAFGNDKFEPLHPNDEMLYVIDHHDQGWVELDAAPKRDSATGLPWHLIDAPQDHFLQSGVGSPDFNEAHHAFCGLISSMHTWGLYNRRYGISDKVLLDDVPGDYRRQFEDMLDGQLARQARLKAKLAENDETAAWIEDDRLFQSYKQLQFFDTVALYFHCTHAADRGPAGFPHVPMAPAKDVTVHVEPIDTHTYCFDPYPFREEGLYLAFEGRYMGAVDGGDDQLTAAMAAAPTDVQTVQFVAK